MVVHTVRDRLFSQRGVGLHSARNALCRNLHAGWLGFRAFRLRTLNPKPLPGETSVKACRSHPSMYGAYGDSREQDTTCGGHLNWEFPKIEGPAAILGNPPIVSEAQLNVTGAIV